MTTLVRNIKTDHSAVGDGSTNDASHFNDFNTWALANQGTDSVELDVPAGTYFFSSSARFCKGVKDLTIIGAGLGSSSLKSTDSLFSQYVLGGLSVAQKGLTATTSGGGKSARIETAYAGATTVTLTSTSFGAGYISRFTVGGCMMIGGLDLQGLWQAPFGFPQNVHYFEFVLITAINTGTGVITFTSFNTGAGLQNTYKSTWPLYNSGSEFEIDAGGPATIWMLDSSWNCVQEVRDITLDTITQIGDSGRSTSVRNVNIQQSGQLGAIPSGNYSWSAINTDYTGCTMEVDKLITTMNMDTVTMSLLKFQSSSTDYLIADNLTITNALQGTPKNTIISNSNLNALNIGASDYGASDTVVCTDSVISAITAQGINQGITGAHYTMSNGIISFPSSAETGLKKAASIFVPGHYCFWVGTYENMGSFKILDVTQDPWPGADYQTTSTALTISSGSPNLGTSGAIFVAGDVGKIISAPGAGTSGGVLWAQIITVTDSQNVILDTNASTSLSAATKTIEWGTSNVHVQTNLTGGLPSLPGLSNIRTFPATAVTFSNCTGCNEAVSLSSAPAGKPLWSYSKYTYSSPTYPMTAAVNLATQKIWGRLVSLKINVITPYGGAGSGTLNAAGQFQCQTIKADNTAFNYVPVINLKIAGERVITPSGVTGTQSGDSSLSVPEAVWFTNSLIPRINQDLSSSPPVFTIEIITDQGIMANVAPLRLRLHS